MPGTPWHVTCPAKCDSFFAVRLQPRFRKETTVSECRVQRCGRVSLAENEPVAMRIVGMLWIHIQHPVIKHGQDVGDAEARSDMRSAGAMHHLQSATAYRSR